MRRMYGLNQPSERLSGGRAIYWVMFATAIPALYISVSHGPIGGMDAVGIACAIILGGYGLIGLGVSTSELGRRRRGEISEPEPIPHWSVESGSAVNARKVSLFRRSLMLNRPTWSVWFDVILESIGVLYILGTAVAFDVFNLDVPEITIPGSVVAITFIAYFTARVVAMIGELRRRTALRRRETIR